MGRNSSNILDFALLRQEADEGAGPVDKAEELQAISSCLDYLYGELRRLDQSLAARLIGAASESIRQEIRQGQQGRSV
ncbi:hypothetical protein [Ferruginivarius sediminum]|uniref:Uncharacterized protein n=1 Tax=Ferruginivarius sediminum TaxID=2661937 RepID=A0A369TB35_9PROT|nr:hypothetical protein [Ferruginivarius sediminum]RDD61714.1 hypothetical protein DRB17_10980 [Ferruginivarius sediminum]